MRRRPIFSSVRLSADDVNNKSQLFTDCFLQKEQGDPPDIIMIPIFFIFIILYSMSVTQ